jgi:hypothetical protein
MATMAGVTLTEINNPLIPIGQIVSAIAGYRERLKDKHRLMARYTACIMGSMSGHFPDEKKLLPWIEASEVETSDEEYRRIKNKIKKNRQKADKWLSQKKN